MSGTVRARWKLLGFPADQGASALAAHQHGLGGFRVTSTRRPVKTQTLEERPRHMRVLFLVLRFVFGRGRERLFAGLLWFGLVFLLLLSHISPRQSSWGNHFWKWLQTFKFLSDQNTRAVR